MTTVRRGIRTAQARGGRAPRRPKVITYPETDGKPMAETPIHWEESVRIQQALAAWFHADATVLVGADIMLYWVPGDPKQSISPDVYVAKGVERDRPRDVYLVWEEGAPPAVVIELTSRSTRLQDQGRKREVYARIGVREYFLYDPRGEWLEPRLQGYRLHGDHYEPLSPVEGALRSEELGLRLVIEEGRLQMYDQATGSRLLSPAERAVAESEARRAAEARITQLEALLRERRPPA